MVVGGDGLGAADDVLVVIGMLIISSPVTGPVPKRLHVIGSVLAPRGSEQALGQALAGGTGSVTYYPYAEGQQVKVLSGQVRLSPAVLANPAGQPDDILVVAGQVVVTGEVTSVGYRTRSSPGSSRRRPPPRRARAAVQVQGQAIWYEGANPRIYNGDARLGPDFLRLLDAPTALVVLGDLIIEDGVTEAALREKLTGITVFGDVIAPAELIGAVQVLATDVFGDIKAERPGQRRTRWIGKLSSAASTRRTAPRCTPTSPAAPATARRAADLMQEVFLRAWQHLDKLAGLPEDGQRGWLFTVARNLSVDAAGHQRTTDGTQRALESDRPPSRGAGGPPAPRSSPPSAPAWSRRRSRSCRSSSGSPSRWPPQAS